MPVKLITEREINDIFLRGVETILPSRPEFLKLLKQSRKPLRVKYGIDPTTPDLHLGYLTVLLKLKFLQEKGHKIVILIGDFTARFGDPTEKLKTRGLRDKADVLALSRGYKNQISKILNPKLTEWRFNSEWYDKMSAEELLRLESKATVAQVLERDMFQQRLKQKLSIGLHEPAYPILQGYDSVMIKSDMTVIGKDQIFNELIGRELQEKAGQKPQMILGSGLLVGTDGKRKMSQSLGNYISLNDSAKEQYGKIMSVPDFAILQYAELLTNLPLEDLRQDVLKRGKPARDAKARVALSIVSQLHGKAAAISAQKNFEEVFSFGKTPLQMREIFLIKRKISIVDCLVQASLAASRSQAGRLVAQGGVKLNGVVVKDRNFILETRPGRKTVLSSGRNFVNLKFKK